MNRKDFLKTTGRILIIGGMTTATGYLVAKQKLDVTCSVSPDCKKCGQFAKCELPQALDRKKINRGIEAINKQLQDFSREEG